MNVFGDRNFRLVVFVLLGCVLLVGWYAHTDGFALGLRIATDGFSVLEVLEARANPDGFARDFPGGARLTTANSLTIYLYFLIQDLTGLDGLRILYLMIMAELVTLLVGAWILWAALVAQFDRAVGTDPVQFKLAFVWIALLLVVSNLQRANMANFGFPFFHGQFYGFADGFRLAALGLALRQQWARAAIVFAICFSIHPIKAVVGISMAGAFAVFVWRSLVSTRVIIAALLAGCVCGTWYWFQLRSDGAPVPLNDFVAYTRTLQSHWYPVDLRLFDELHLRGLSPFSAVLVASVLALAQPGWQPLARRQLLFGLAALLVLVVFGLYVSVDQSSAALIRVSLVRASTLITLLAPFLLVAGVLLAWKRGNWVVAAGLIAFSMASFSFGSGLVNLSLVFVLGLATFHLATRNGFDVPLLAAVVAGTGALLWVTINTNLSLDSVEVAGSAVVFFGVFALLFAVTERFRPTAMAWIITFAAIGGGVLYANDKATQARWSHPVAAAYREAQLWAKENTAHDALFMVDPCRTYGWRDFSGRPSIGTIREWYMTSWIYIDRFDLLQKGRAYAKSLGFDMEPFRNEPFGTPRICDAARKLYYDPTLAGQRRIAADHDVDFFMLEKAFADDWIAQMSARFAFENEHFAIIAATRLD